MLQNKVMSSMERQLNDYAAKEAGATRMVKESKEKVEEVGAPSLPQLSLSR